MFIRSGCFSDRSVDDVELAVEDDQCSRVGCSKKAAKKPPSAMVLLPVANKSKVLTYCKFQTLSYVK